VASPAGQYFELLVRHETRLWSMAERSVRRTPGAVSLGRYEVLRTVGRAEAGSRVQDVADALRITVGAASRIVDRLVTDGLLARSPHPTDRRSVRLDLTPVGQQALDTTGPALELALADLLGGVDADTVRTVANALEDIDRHLDAVRPEPMRPMADAGPA